MKSQFFVCGRGGGIPGVVWMSLGWVWGVSVGWTHGRVCIPACMHAHMLACTRRQEAQCAKE